MTDLFKDLRHILSEGMFVTSETEFVVIEIGAEVRRLASEKCCDDKENETLETP